MGSIPFIAWLFYVIIPIGSGIVTIWLLNRNKVKGEDK